MTIKAQGASVLVEILDKKAEKVSSGGIIIATETSSERGVVASNYGKVIDIGSEAFYDWHSPGCKVGDIVTFPRYAGIEVGDRKNLHRLINDTDIKGSGSLEDFAQEG